MRCGRGVRGVTVCGRCEVTEVSVKCINDWEGEGGRGERREGQCQCQGEDREGGWKEKEKEKKINGGWPDCRLSTLNSWIDWV